MTIDRENPHFVTLGMFIIDEFSYLDEEGKPTSKSLAPQERQTQCSETYQALLTSIGLLRLAAAEHMLPLVLEYGQRTPRLPAHQLGMIIDRGNDFPSTIQAKLESYGDMWLYRDQADRGTTRALNSYRGDHRSFAYLTPRIRITPRDLGDTKFARPTTLHFICSPSRAESVVSELRELSWSPLTIYEPIPDRCVPQELPALVRVLPSISILSPNAEEALSLLSVPLPATKPLIEEAAARFLELGVGTAGTGSVIIRSGSMGAYVANKERSGTWIDAFWTAKNGGADKVVDVTGAGNSFLGGLAAGLLLADGDINEASLYATVSSSFVIEQEGLPKLSSEPRENRSVEEWNGDSPERRLKELQIRHGRQIRK